MMAVVKLTLEAVQDVIDARKTGRFECITGIDRAIAAATDQYHWSVVGVTGKFLDLANEVRIDVPVGNVVPGHMQASRRVADKQEFHFAAAVDE